MAYNRKQAYYNREYDRLITQAKKLYNMMNLGTVFGPSLPSFEKILNYAGTKSGLTRPSKKSLKALRKLQTESGIYWGIAHTLPKRDKKAHAKLEDLREEQGKQQEAISKAKKTISGTYKRQLSSVSQKAKTAFLKNIMYAINRMLSELRFYRNLFREDLEDLLKHSFQKIGTRTGFRFTGLTTGVKAAEEIIGIIENYLTSGNGQIIAYLSQCCEEFYERFPEGVTKEELYDDAPNIRKVVVDGMIKLLNDMEYKRQQQEQKLTKLYEEQQQQQQQEVIKPSEDFNRDPETFDPLNPLNPELQDLF